MNRHLARALAALTIGLMTGACGDDATAVDTATDRVAGTHIGNPGGVRFTTAALAAAPSAEPATDPVPSDDRVRDADGVVFHLTEVRLGIRDIELDLPATVRCDEIARDLVGATCSDLERKIRIDGPMAADLLRGTATPSIDAVRVPALAYPRIDYRVVDLSDAQAILAPGDPLRDAAYSVRADFEAADGELTTVAIALDFNEDIRIENRDGVALPPGGTLTVAFDTSGWFDGLRLASCVASGEIEVRDGIAIVDEDTDCDDLEGTVRDNVTRSPRLLLTP